MRTRTILLFATVSSLLSSVCFAQIDSCDSFAAMVKRVYDFKPSKLTPAQREAKAPEMDRVWNAVVVNPSKLTPCLRTALEDQNADAWFRFDGSSLLVEVDPSPSSKLLQVRNYSKVDLDDVDLSVWVSTLAHRGAEGFDISEAAGRWLIYPGAHYYLPQHGGYEVKTAAGALFLYGSMDESLATPVLVEIIKQKNHPQRELAAALLVNEATPEAVRALKQIDQSGLSERGQKTIRTFLDRPPLLVARAKPLTSRDEFIKSFKDIVNGDWTKFEALVEKVPDGEKDVVAVLKPEDIPLLRKVRRLEIAKANQHAIEFYMTFSQILLTLTWRPELVR